MTLGMIPNWTNQFIFLTFTTQDNSRRLNQKETGTTILINVEEIILSPGGKGNIFCRDRNEIYSTITLIFYSFGYYNQEMTKLYFS